MDYIITAIVLLWTHSTYGVQVRLVGSSSPLEGRVEVYHNNRWGTICDDFFSTNDAGVICSMLGFERDGAKFFMKAYFGEGTGQIWLDDMKCEGSESSVENCIGSSWGIHNCHHSEDVGVRCRPKLKVRLVGGSHYYEGRIEVFFSGTWGTVCDDSFDDLDAQVFCHMLGYKRDNAVSKTSAFYGPGSGKIWLDDLQCTGTETSVGDCRMSGEFGCHNCGHSEDAGVVCRPGTCQALPSVTNGRFSPDSCTSSFNSAGLACTLFCNTGYEATSRNTTTCFDTGDWSHQISCADIDECALGTTKCTQQCVNTNGSYECRCNDGYIMMPDKRTCKGVTYRIHLQRKQGAAELPDYVVLDGNVTRNVRLALVSPKKLNEVMVYNVTGANVGEITDISLLKNADVNFVSVHNPYTNGYYIQRFESSNQVITGKLCKRQFGVDLNMKVDYNRYKGNFKPFKDIDMIDCKLACIETPTFPCQAVHFHISHRCNVLEKIDNLVYEGTKKANIVSKLTGTTYQDIDSC